MVAGLARRGPEDLHPSPLELLPAPAQGAGTLQACVVSQPGALGAVPLLSAEQVRGTAGGGGPAWSRLCLLGQCPRPPRLTRPAPPSRFRVSCQKIIAHKMFDHVVLVFIFLNCVTIALERPDIDPGSTVRRPCGPGAWGGRGRGGRQPRPPLCACRSASSSAFPTTFSRRFSWPR